MGTKRGTTKQAHTSRSNSRSRAGAEAREGAGSSGVGRFVRYSISWVGKEGGSVGKGSICWSVGGAQCHQRVACGQELRGGVGFTVGEFAIVPHGWLWALRGRAAKEFLRGVGKSVPCGGVGRRLPGALSCWFGPQAVLGQAAPL